MPTITTPVAQPVSFLTEPFNHIGAWVQYFSNAEIPVLAATAKALEELRAIEDDVDANMLTSVIQSDPLMTLKVMAQVAKIRHHSESTQTESVTTSLILMGIAPFFRYFGPQRSVEDWLADQPEALKGLQELLNRAERAGQFALGFAVHRGDTDASVIHLAAYLHDFVEMLIWLHAPMLAVKIHEALTADANLRSTVIQREVLGIALDDLRHSLMKLWHLPEFLINISDERHAEFSNVRNVVLAVRLARHTTHGWDNAALPNDVEDIAKLLNASPRVTLSFLHKIDHPIVEIAPLRGLPTWNSSSF